MDGVQIVEERGDGGECERLGWWMVGGGRVWMGGMIRYWMRVAD